MLKKCQTSLVLSMKNVYMCAFKTSPFVPAPRAHMLKHVCAWCRYTRGRFERTHGDVLSGHTGFRTLSQTTHHTAHIHNTPQHTTSHGDTDRERETEKEGKEREEKMKEERQDKTTEDKRRQDNTKEKREDRRLIFSVVVRGRS